MENGSCPWLDSLSRNVYFSALQTIRIQKKKHHCLLLKNGSNQSPSSCRGNIRFRMTDAASFPLTAFGRAEEFKLQSFSA